MSKSKIQMPNVKDGRARTAKTSSAESADSGQYLSFAISSNSAIIGEQGLPINRGTTPDIGIEGHELWHLFTDFTGSSPEFWV